MLDPIADQIVYQRNLLTFAATATDPDAGQSLSYSLDAGAPPSAYINPSSGIFTWTPSLIDDPGDYFITVRVTDDGAPPLNDSRTFKVTVLASPELRFTNITPAGNGSVTFSWATQPQKTYRVSYKTNLNQPVWIPLVDLPSSGTTLSFTNDTTTDTQRYFHVEMLP